MINEFNFFRLNCWVEDLSDNNYERAIGIAIYEFLLSQSNQETPRNEVYKFIKESLGIKINYESFQKFIDHDSNIRKEALEDDILINLTEQALEKFRERENKFSIRSQIKRFIERFNLDDDVIQSIENILYRSLFININSFIVGDLKSLISESIEADFSVEDVDQFNEFLDWDDKKKNQAIFSLFEKAIEFAILTSGRGVKAISKDIFTDKTYYLDANVIIRALGVDGVERQESILSILQSCKHDGIDFKISKTTYDEVNSNLSNRTDDIKAKTKSGSVNHIKDIIDDLPLNNSFETHYLQKRKDSSVSSPNSYRLHLEQELQKLMDTFNIEVERIKGLPQKKIKQFSDKIYRIKKNKYDKWFYSKGAAIVDAKNILHVRNVRDHNDHNYRDVKSFYLTTDGTLNEIVSDLYPEIVPETILPSQVFVIHNSFQKKASEDDYKDFIKFIKIRRTDFKLPGQEVFNYIEQVRAVTSNQEDIVSTINAYANYRYSERNKHRNGDDDFEIVPIKEFTETRLEKELAKTRKAVNQLDEARNEAIQDLPSLYKLSRIVSYSFEILLLSAAAFLFYLILNNYSTTGIIISAIVAFRLILFSTKGDFGLNRKVRNSIFDRLTKRQSFFKIHGKDDEYIKAVNNFKK